MTDPTLAPPDWDRLTSFPERLKQLREFKRLTQEYVAREAGISQGTLSKIENGESTELKASTVEGLARVLNVSLYWLRSGLLEIDIDNLNRSTRDLIRLYEALRPESREMVDHMIRLLFESDNDPQRSRRNNVPPPPRRSRR